MIDKWMFKIQDSNLSSYVTCWGPKNNIRVSTGCTDLNVWFFWQLVSKEPIQFHSKSIAFPVIGNVIVVSAPKIIAIKKIYFPKHSKLGIFGDFRQTIWYKYRTEATTSFIFIVAKKRNIFSDFINKTINSIFLMKNVYQPSHLTIHHTMLKKGKGRKGESITISTFRTNSSNEITALFCRNKETLCNLFPLWAI